MSQTAEQILRAALALPAAERTGVIDALVAAEESESGVPFDESWLEEIERRSADYDAGLIKSSSPDEVIDQVRRKYALGQ